MYGKGGNPVIFTDKLSKNLCQKGKKWLHIHCIAYLYTVYGLLFILMIDLIEGRNSLNSKKNKQNEKKNLHCFYL